MVHAPDNWHDDNRDDTRETNRGGFPLTRLSWNEIRDRAAAFAGEWRDAAYEKGETQSFYNDFFEVFGVRRRSVSRYEEHVAKLDNRFGFIDLFWPGVLLVEQKSAGRDLETAYGQAGEYLDALPEHERPRYILVSDFRTFELHDLSERATMSFPLAELPAHVEETAAAPTCAASRRSSAG
ncbi:MAG: hypothetical protein OXU69_15780 [Gemmatimonadota bacterium]|nr:hypothetical protein [Gemmatimonadota bacterium]MDE2986162.1 hypothetical protein [Gemmatimonadota bacterium]